MNKRLNISIHIGMTILVAVVLGVLVSGYFTTLLLIESLGMSTSRATLLSYLVGALLSAVMVASLYEG